jgi:hypothetical protein
MFSLFLHISILIREPQKISLPKCFYTLKIHIAMTETTSHMWIFKFKLIILRKIKLQ